MVYMSKMIIWMVVLLGSMVLVGCSGLKMLY